MKKFLFILAFMFSMFCSEGFAQTQWYKTTAYAFANVYNEDTNGETGSSLI